MRTENESLRLVLGGIAGNLAAAAVLGVVGFWTKFINPPDELAWMALLNVGLLPVIVGAVAAWVWRRIKLGRVALMTHGLWVSLMGMVGAAVVFHEGILCLLMAWPIHYLAVSLTLVLAHRLFAGSDDRLQVTVFPLIGLVVLAEARLAPRPPEEVFTDEIRITAPPAKVWPHVVGFAPITAPPDFWFFRLGLPYPVETPPGADAVGRERRCVFSDGVVFRETVRVFEPGRRLVFDIVEAPPHPELLGHFEARWGEFELKDNGDGTTTLIGRSAYVLHVRPRWYFNLWTRHLGRAVHLRVMENARRLAESP